MLDADAESTDDALDGDAKSGNCEEVTKESHNKQLPGYKK